MNSSESKKNKSKWISWMKAFRIFTLSGSAIPVLLGGLMSLHSPSFQWFAFVLSLVAMVSLQIGANLHNDSDDYINKVDTEESYNSSGVIVDNLLEQRSVAKVGKLFFLMALLLGIYPVVIGGPVVLALALAGIASAYFYTRKPFEFKYRGLGLPLIFLMFGPLPVLGSYYLQSRELSVQAFLGSIMIGLLTTSILHANDIRDISTDQKAGIKTCSIVIGAERAKHLYTGMIIFTYLLDVAAVIAGVLPFISLVCLLTIPIAWKNIEAVYSPKQEALQNLDRGSAMLQMVYGVLLILTMLG